MNIDLKYQHDEIEDEIKNYMEEDNSMMILQLAMLPGVGKTFTALKYFMSRRDQYQFIYLSSMHKIIDDNLELLPRDDFGDILHLRGRGKLCINEEYRKLENYGVNISSLCDECKYRDSCEYYKILYDLNDIPQSWVGVYEHLFTQVPKYYEKHGDLIDVIILDECFLNRLCQTRIVKENVLDYTEKVIKRVNGRNKTKHKLRIWIDELKRALLSDDLKFPKNEKIVVNFNLLKENKIEDKKFENLYNNAMIEHWQETKEIQYNIIQDIFFLSQHLRDDDNYNSSVITPRKTRNSNRIIYFNIFRKEVLDLPIKTIILDATTPYEIYEELTGKPVWAPGTIIYPDVNVYQLTTAKNPMATLDRSKDKVFHYISAICRKHIGEKVLIVCRKKYEKSLQKYLEVEGLDNFSIDHYDGLRGSNEYMNYDVCVLMGGAYRNKDDLERDATIMEIPKDKLHEQCTKNEMKQCLHRIRPILKRGKTWYILSNEELEFSFPSDRVKKLSYRDFDKMLFGDVIDKRIINDILELTKNEELTRVEIIKEVKGDMHNINRLINKLVSEKQLKKVEEKRKGVRPAVKYERNY